MFCRSSRRHLECLRSHHQYFPSLLSIAYRYQDPIRGQQRREGGLKKKKERERLATRRGQYYLSIPRAFLAAQLYDLNQTGFCRAGKAWQLCAPLTIFPLRCRAEEASLGRSKAHRFS